MGLTASVINTSTHLPIISNVLTFTINLLANDAYCADNEATLTSSPK